MLRQSLVIKTTIDGARIGCYNFAMSLTKVPFKKRPAKKGQYSKDYNYNRKLNFVTPTELEFFKILMAVVNREHYYIVPQVHLSCLFDYKIKGQNWYGAMQHINRKSVDYVVCTLKGLNPICAIELDDDSHLRKDRIERDKIVEERFKQADLPLLRVSVHEQNNIQMLRSKLLSIKIPSMINF